MESSKIFNSEWKYKKQQNLTYKCNPIIIIGVFKINLGKFNQRRVSMVKYIGELYNYRMIGSSIIFKTLYTLILFGVIYDGLLLFFTLFFEFDKDF